MKTIENVTIYKCDFCKKELKRKHSMILHEKICNSNPENFKACMNGCVHLEMEKVILYFEVGHSEDGVEYSEQNKDVFKCNKMDKLMYPWSIERKDLANKYPSTFDEQSPMPKVCEDFKDTESWDEYFDRMQRKSDLS